MRRISLALLSTALLSIFPLAGRYLAARVGEQDHDYDMAADQIDLALSQSPGDPELIYAAFRMRMYAGRIDQAAGIATMNAINDVILRSAFMPVFFGTTVAAAVLAVVAGMGSALAQQDFPSRPITYIYPFAAGGAGDEAAIIRAESHPR